MVQYIHVIILNNNTVFLHASLLTSYDKNAVLLECELMNKYTYKYKPNRLEETIKIHQNGEIDFFVKKYMKIYGINKVRGGSYCHEKLTDMEKQHIINEGKLTIDSIEDKSKSIQNILDEYSNINNWTDAEITGEIDRIDKLEKKYLHETYMLSHLSKFKNYILDRSFFKDLEWIGIKCIQQINNSVPYIVPSNRIKFEGESNWLWDNIVIEINKEYIENNDKEWLLPNRKRKSQQLSKSDMNKYMNIIEKIKAFNYVFTEYTEIESDYIPKIHMYSPETVFDVFMYHNNDQSNWIESYNMLEKYIHTVEYIGYCVINRIDEYEFDVKSYSANFKDELSYRRRYISNTYNIYSCP